MSIESATYYLKLSFNALEARKRMVFTNSMDGQPGMEKALKITLKRIGLFAKNAAIADESLLFIARWMYPESATDAVNMTAFCRA